MSLLERRNDRTEHRYAEARLSAYLDGELSSRERARVERHVGACRRCRWELETLHQTIQWTRGLPALPVPRVFAVPVPVRAVRAAPRPWGLPVLQGATAVVALLFLVAVAGQMLLPRLLPAAAPRVQVALGPTVAPAVAVVEVTREVQAAEGAAEAQDSQAAPPPLALEAAPPALEPEVTAASLAAPAATVEPEEAHALGTELGPTSTPEARAKLQIVGGSPTPSEAMKQAEAPGIGGAEGVTQSLVVGTPTFLPTPTAPAGPDTVPAPLPTTGPEAEVAVASAPQPTAEAQAEVAAAPAALPTTGAGAEVEAARAGAEGVEDETRAVREALGGWLDRAAIALGLAFVLLGVVTIVLMVRRLRRS